METWALEVINKLTEKYENINAFVVGDCPEKLKEKYRNKRIKFTGYLNKEELNKIYSMSDIFIYPSPDEPFGFAFLEAMSWGISAITYDNKVKREIIENKKKTGLLVKKYEVDAFVKATEELIKNEELRKRMSKNCVNEIDKGKFSIKERNKKLERIYGFEKVVLQ